MSIENKIELLWEAAKTLQDGQQTHKLLKSYYINTCRKLAKNNIQIPKEKFALSQMCPYCGSLWNDSEFGLKLIPKQLKSTSKAKRLIEKFEKNDDGATSKVLNKKQRNRAKWLKKRISNHLAIKCCQCKHVSNLKMGNQKSKSLEQEAKNKEEKGSCSIVSENTAVRYKHSKSGVETKTGQERKISSSALKKSKKIKLEEKLITVPKTKNKTKANIAANKVISKTQKQNSLLQLAALLQKQSTVDLKSSAQKKLQSLLK